MNFLPKSVSKLIDELGRLPGIGPKSAQRLAFYILGQNESRTSGLGESILKIKEGVIECEICHCLTDKATCDICSNSARDRQTLCVVESTLDMIAIEKTGEFKGVYHVLQGRLSPLDGIGPENLKIDSLFARLDSNLENIKEIILALNPDLEGDTTSLFLQRKLAQFSALRLTRIARGIPSGGNLEYTDESTLIRAIQGRQTMC